MIDFIIAHFNSSVARLRISLSSGIRMFACIDVIVHKKIEMGAFKHRIQAFPSVLFLRWALALPKIGGCSFLLTLSIAKKCEMCKKE